MHICMHTCTHIIIIIIQKVLQTFWMLFVNRMILLLVTVGEKWQVFSDQLRCLCSHINLFMWLSIFVFQLAQCQDRMMELEQEVENPNAKNRARLIEGKDPEPLELQKMIEKVRGTICGKEIFLNKQNQFIKL